MTQPTTMIVNMAKAMAGVNWQPFDPEIHGSPINRRNAQEMWLKAATAALRTLLEPSEEMIEAGRMVDGTITAGDVFRSMILSALDEGDPA